MPYLPMSPYLLTILLLVGSNTFMTAAWYWHLRFREVPLWQVHPGELGSRLCRVLPGGAGKPLWQLRLQRRPAENDSRSNHAFGLRRVLARLSAPADHLEPDDWLCADRGRRIFRISRPVLTMGNSSTSSRNKRGAKR